MILLFIIGCGIWFLFGWLVGRESGRTEIERRIIKHVTESPHYEDEVVSHFIGAFDSVYHGKREGK